MKLDFFEEVASDAIKLRKVLYDKAKNFLSQTLKYFKKIREYLKRYLEIKYYQYDLYKKHKQLGQYVSEQYSKDNATDFSYDVKYKTMIKEINQINLVIKTISTKDNI